MKYIEELTFGDIFEYNKELFILTKDFDNKNNVLCVSIKNGQSRWILNNSIVNVIELYRLDDENNFANIKPKTSKDY